MENLKSIGRSAFFDSFFTQKRAIFVGGCPNVMFPYTCPLHAAVDVFAYPAISACANMAFLTNIDGEG